jgi:L-aspartate oxidase
VADVEFVQFHPTALYLPGEPGPRPLLSEALRGEGAVLRDDAGERFVDEMQPRDIVAAAIAARGRAWLDVSPVDRFETRFPTLAGAARAAGLDPPQDWLPVAPAAHYLCGGVLTDLDGATTLPGLWAAGEVACTGVHGANRLASNSLLEAAVFGARAGRAAAAEGQPAPARLVRLTAPELPAEALQALRQAMSREAGVVRDAAGLSRLIGLIDGLEAAHGRAAELVAARLVAATALARTESRGAHFRSDAGPAEAVPRRTFVRWSDLPAAEAWKHAAE